VVGYSGHEYGLEPSVVAVSLGAKIIERHITLDHTMWGSDHAASLEIHAMDMLHKRIKEIRNVLGDGVKRITGEEIKSLKKLRGL
jgi:N-acetylneuraminate synthase